MSNVEYAALPGDGLPGDGEFRELPRTMPKRFFDRIKEVRSAIREGREIPQPSAEYRSTAQFVRRLFTPRRQELSWEEKFEQRNGRPMRHLSPTAKALRKTERKTDAEIAHQNGITVEALQDGKLRLKAQRLAEEIRRDHVAMTRLELTMGTHRPAYEEQ